MQIASIIRQSPVFHYFMALTHLFAVIRYLSVLTEGEFTFYDLLYSMTIVKEVFQRNIRGYEMVASRNVTPFKAANILFSLVSFCPLHDCSSKTEG